MFGSINKKHTCFLPCLLACLIRNDNSDDVGVTYVDAVVWVCEGYKGEKVHRLREIVLSSFSRMR